MKIAKCIRTLASKTNFDEATDKVEEFLIEYREFRQHSYKKEHNLDVLYSSYRNSIDSYNNYSFIREDGLTGVMQYYNNDYGKFVNDLFVVFYVYYGLFTRKQAISIFKGYEEKIELVVEIRDYLLECFEEIVYEYKLSLNDECLRVLNNDCTSAYTTDKFESHYINNYIFESASKILFWTDCCVYMSSRVVDVVKSVKMFTRYIGSSGVVFKNYSLSDKMLYLQGIDGVNLFNIKQQYLSLGESTINNLPKVNSCVYRNLDVVDKIISGLKYLIR